MEDYFQYLSFEKRYSNHTIKAYKADLDSFRSFLLSQYCLTDDHLATRQMVRSWIHQLVDQGMVATTLRRKISTLRSYYRFLVIRDVLDVSPVSKVVLPKTGARLPKFVPQPDMMKLYDSDRDNNTNQQVRDQLIIQLLYSTGMRVSEICDLKFSQIDLSRQVVKVLGKGSKERIIPLTPVTAEELRLWCCSVTLSDCEESADGYVFKTEQGKKIYPRLVYRIVKYYLSQVTTIDKKSPHVLRHSFATHLLDEGAELVAIKALLGHSSLAATQVYTHTSIDKVQRIYKQAHPRATKRKE
ncbi:MAG: tyrosine-type recombinase/integrase [Bacteroidales bacterium]|nr:tyrosine-type recombinase/integrase [Bacteroidales bacterium]MDD3666982.1 tyrosine-type recombinase/integrase [Bacteroidales bacterium]